MKRAVSCSKQETAFFMILVEPVIKHSLQLHSLPVSGLQYPVR